MKTMMAPHLVSKAVKDDGIADAMALFEDLPAIEAPADSPSVDVAPAAPPPVDTAPAAPAPAAPAAPAPADELRALLDQNRQLVQTVLQQRNQPQPQPKVDPTDAEIAAAVKSGDYSTLEKHGLSLSQWSDRTLNELTADPKEKEIHELKMQLQAMSKWREEQDAKAQQQARAQAQARREAIENEVKGEITKSIADDPELGIILALAGGVEDVYSNIARYAEETGRLYGQPQWLAPREAAKAVLAARKGELDKLLGAAQNHPSFQQLFAAQQAAQQQAVSAQATVPTSVSASQVSGTAPVVGDTLENRNAEALKIMQRHLASIQR